ncbi:MAG: hypothetical protein ABW277_04265 [Longimicrobiaceae bacterium]
MRPVLLAVAAALLATPVHAQLRADASFPAVEVAAGAVVAFPTGQAPPDSAARPSGRSDRFISRAALGGLGMVAGALGVGAASYAVFPHCTGCEDPGLVPALFGGVAGAVVGTAVFAAIPEMGDGCSYLDRFGRALLGAGAGALVGVAGGWAAGVPVVAPFGLAGGSAWATLGCRRRTEA